MIKVCTKSFTEQSGRFKHQTEHQAGLDLIGQMLREMYGIDFCLIKKDERGKPYLSSHPDIYISISHSHGCAACAVGDRPLGVDVEKIRPYAEKIWCKVLNPREQQILTDAALTKKERQELFYRFWTLKESYVKAEGCGFCIPPQEITFVLDRDGTVISGPEGYQFQVKKVRGSYMTASCQKT